MIKDVNSFFFSLLPYYARPLQTQPLFLNSAGQPTLLCCWLHPHCPHRWGINYYSYPCVSSWFVLGSSRANEPVSDIGFRVHPQGMGVQVAAHGKGHCVVYVERHGVCEGAWWCMWKGMVVCGKGHAFGTCIVLLQGPYQTYPSSSYFCWCIFADHTGAKAGLELENIMQVYGKAHVYCICPSYTIIRQWTCMLHVMPCHRPL